MTASVKVGQRFEKKKKRGNFFLEVNDERFQLLLSTNSATECKYKQIVLLNTVQNKLCY